MKDFAAIDFETVNGSRSSVCSVGIVIVRGGEIVEKIYRLIKPAPNFYAWFCQRVHGLSDEDTCDAAEFPAVWAEIAPLIEGLPLCTIRQRMSSSRSRALRNALPPLHIPLHLPSLTQNFRQATTKSSTSHRLGSLWLRFN